VRFGGRDNASGGPHDRVASEARRITSLVSIASQLDEEKKKKSRDYRLMF